MDPLLEAQILEDLRKEKSEERAAEFLWDDWE